MYIIIAGTGIVGSHIASLLVEAKNEVTIVEQSEERVDNILHRIDVKTIMGNAATPKILKEAEVHRADLLIAVTKSDETNMLTCFLAKELGAAMTVARVRNPEYSGYFVTAAKLSADLRKVIRPKNLGIDLFINPEFEAAMEMTNLLSSFYPSPIVSFADGRVQITDFRVGDKRSLKKALGKIKFPAPCVVASVVRSGEIIAPVADETIQEGDHLFLVSARDCSSDSGNLFIPPQQAIKSVVILGGGYAGLLIAEGLQKEGIAVKVIEEDIVRSEEIAAKLEGAVVLQGDGTDRDFLIEQDVPSADAFVATTGNDELNILCGLLAKSLGVPRSLTLVNKPGYIPLAEAVGIDAAASPPLLAGNKIAHFVLHAEAVSATFIGGQQLQAVEFVVTAKANIAKRKVEEAGLPKGAILGAVVRGDDIIIPPCDCVIAPDDHVIVVAPLSVIPAVEKLFT
ncbi:Trk system potassium transporter TrkA [Chloroflexota bacterium]